MSYILILEFGSQTTDRIGARLAQMGVPVRYNPTSSTRIEDFSDAAGVVISGGPKGARDPDAYPFDSRLFDIDKPILGICYGLQLGGIRFGAGLHRRTKEYGEAHVEIVGYDPVLEGCGQVMCGWMNHGDSITDGDFRTLGYTEKRVPAIIRRGKFLGVQFHPEVSHTENGTLLLRNWAEKECGLATSDAGFDADKFIEEAIYAMRQEVGDDLLLAYISGGVDSMTAAALAKVAELKMKCVYLENGFGRKNEALYAQEIVIRCIGEDLYIHDEPDMFLSAFAGLHDDRAKRNAFRTVYNQSRERIERKFDLRNTVLFDGTNVTDKRESGTEAGTTIDGSTVDTIKDHHNTGGWKGRKVSPLAGLTKEQVRAVARRLGLPPEVSERPPFPGPGLSVRYPTAYYPVSGELFHMAKEMAAGYGMDAFVLPRKGVGLKGDSRALEHIAVISGDRDWRNIRRISKHLIEELPICRVIYLLENEAGARLPDSDFNKGIPFQFDKGSLDRLREVTEIAEKTTADYCVRYSQMPVFAVGGPNGWINVIRDVDSEDFRTVRPLRKPEEFPWECAVEIQKRSYERLGDEAGLLCLEVSDKPGGTTEFE